MAKKRHRSTTEVSYTPNAYRPSLKKPKVNNPDTVPESITLDYILKKRLQTFLQVDDRTLFVYSVNKCLLSIAKLEKQKNITNHVIKKGAQLTAFFEYLCSIGFIHLYTDLESSHGLGAFDEARQVFSCLIRLDKPAVNKDYCDLLITGVKDDPKIKMVVKWIEAQGPVPEFYTVLPFRMSRNDSITNSTDIQEVGKQKLGRDVFYPYFKRGVDSICESFVKSDAPVMILLGPPGCGKSTFMRTLAAKIKGEVFLTYDTDVMANPSFLSEYYKNHRSSLCLVEDVDTLLYDRTGGNKFMSTLLNSTEGLVDSGKKKIVLSTNLSSVDKIDPALIRTGRCFDVLTFRELTPDEAQAVSVDMQGDERDWSKQKSWSLSDVLNPTQEGLE
jgi:hypothetical protein